MALGSLFSNLFQKKPDADEAPKREAGAPAADTNEAKVRRRLAVEQAVNEAMSAAGVLSSQYKQSSRRIDAAAQRLQVTVDLGRDLAEVSINLLSQVGASIVQRAKAKGEVDIAVVYWRTEVAAGTASPVNLVRQAMADKAQSDVAAAPEPAPVVASAPTAAAKAATSEKIAKLRAMMGDAPPQGAQEAAYDKTQVNPKKGAGEASFEKTQVIQVSTFMATQVMDESAGKDGGKSGKA